jgi:hypothetical protein
MSDYKKDLELKLDKRIAKYGHNNKELSLKSILRPSYELFMP